MSPEEFRKIRKNLGLTQAQLASELGMALRQLSALENSARMVSRKYEFALRWIAFNADRKTDA